MVQPPTIGGDRGVWGQKLLDWVLDKVSGLATETDLNALEAQVSGNISSIETIDDFLDGMPTAVNVSAAVEGVARVDPGANLNAWDLIVADSTGAPKRVRDRYIDLGHEIFGCVGDGVTDDTVGVALAFAAADSLKMPVYVPANKAYLTDTITYKMQAIQGANQFSSALVGKPGKDVLWTDRATLGTTRYRTFIKDVEIRVDDSVDVTATVGLHRGGVGNAGLACDHSDNSVNFTAYQADCNLDRVRFTVTSGTSFAKGRNGSCGIYEQGHLFLHSVFGSLNFLYLRYGWYQDVPDVNTASNSIARDHNTVDRIYFSNCGYPWKIGNAVYLHVNTMMVHGGGTDGPAIHFSSTTTGARSSMSDITINNLMIENADSAFAFTGDVRFVRIDQAVINGLVNRFTWGAHASYVNMLTAPLATPAPIVTVTGDYNTFIVRSGGTFTDEYMASWASDQGKGNSLELLSNYTMATFRGPVAGSQSGHVLHQRDTASLAAGWMDPPFVSGRDLLIHPLNIIPTGASSDYSYVVDTAADFGMALRITLAAGNWSTANLNGAVGAIVGKFLPIGRVRVYVKAKLATGGTVNLSVRTGGTNYGNRTVTLTTSYTVHSFDIDLSATTVGTLLSFLSGVIGGGGAAPLDVAWIGFRPFMRDLAVQTISVSGDNGDAAKTLVVGTDSETQRWNTVLTADRAVTLPTTGVYNGARFRIVREATATGAFNLNVGTGPLKALAASGTWCEVQHDGTAWRLVASGSL